jgi:hypothetical protein
VGRPVATFIRDRTVRAGWKHFVWNGLAPSGRVLPDGSYAPSVSFPALHRTLTLPGTIRLDTRRPRLLHAGVRVGRGRIVIHYAFDVPAHALLLVDGRQAALTRFAATSGRLVWVERFGDGHRARPGPHRVSVLGIDPAGNRSVSSPPKILRIEPSR